MRSALLILGAALLMGAGCPSRPEPRDCTRACAHLAELLRRDRARRGQTATPGLDAAAPRGRANLATCEADCAREGTPEHVACLVRASDLHAWMGCR